MLRHGAVVKAVFISQTLPVAMDNEMFIKRLLPQLLSNSRTFWNYNDLKVKYIRLQKQKETMMQCSALIL